MKLEDITSALKDFWDEFKRVKSGIIGLAFFLIFLVIMVFEPIISPVYKANSEWGNIVFWQDYPRSVPPVWIDLFSSEKHAPTVSLEPLRIDNSGESRRIIFEYQYDFNHPPQDMFFHFDSRGNNSLKFSVERPDGIVIPLFAHSYDTAELKHFRIPVGNDGKFKACAFLKRTDRSAGSVSRDFINTVEVLFSEKKSEMYSNPAPLKGLYKIIVETNKAEESEGISNARINISGSTHGIMGTDSSKRDIWSGIISGVKWALLIGLLTAIFSVFIGVIYGVSAAYFGGLIDAALMRFFEIILSIPILPLIIVISAVFKPNIFVLIFLMVLFFWTGPVKTVRSMALQIKEEVYIEASLALGASHLRIIFKHMIPLLIPYAFASMALYVPGAIVYESVVSLLGLGDPNIVTWGQLLRDANSAGAVISGQWWWIIPPGFCIAAMGMTFAFVGFAMDKILHPKLRTR